MVYCGQPSRGCATCRAKKTKCDRAVPSCGQCVKMGRPCYGYRDEQDLIFRDETKRVMRKAAKVRPRKQGPTASSDAPSETILFAEFPTPNGQISTQALVPSADPRTFVPVTQNPSVSLEIAATGFIFHHYVLKNPNVIKGFMDFLPKLYQKDLAEGGPLPELIASVGLAGIANLKRSPELMVKARMKHSSALKLVNASLQDPVKAKTDSSLTAIMLLALFENITCSSPDSMAAWARHVEGATILAEMRGKEQLETDVGKRLFSHLRHMILVDCLQRRKPIPKSILDWAKDPIHAGPDPEPQLFQILGRLCHLRSEVKVHGVETVATVRLACAIDAEIQAWAATVPEIYRYSLARHNDPQCRIPYHHKYNTVWFATVWNGYRTARLLTLEVIILWLFHHPEDDSISRFISLEMCQAYQNELSDDICASVPQFLEGDNHDPSTAIKGAKAMILTWPLYTAAICFYRTFTRNSWIIEQFEKIGELLGMKQATALSYILANDREITVWDRDIRQVYDNDNDGELEEW